MHFSSWLLPGKVTFRACRLARSTRSRHRPSCPPVPDSELQASVFHTLDAESGGWDGCCCCVQHHAVEVRGPSRIIKTRHHDLHVFLACRTFHGVEHGGLWIPRCFDSLAASSIRHTNSAKLGSRVCGMPAGHDRSGIEFACKEFWCTRRKW